ncbi:hypothetical protein [Micromonospora echinofusca]|uniref:Lipoprotein n=1 Tax=Micromonospora echinofusca TaxID=47858 RepID=A0ABS3VJX4_MICEH|nr:hypothetical protein [Micromonospora echinofusca]MBO4204753.1 hypothetical protein [Micromonospora echinofusca]
MRKTLLPLLVLALVTGLACGSGSGSGGRKSSGSGNSSADRGTDGSDSDGNPDAGDPTPVAKPSASPTRKKVAALTCKQLETAQLGSSTSRYNGYADPIPLLDGMWSGEDGVVVTLQAPCAIGDLTGDGAADAVVPAMMDGGGTGKFWQLVVFRNVNGRPSYVTVTDIGDRTPIENVTISSRQVKVVYLTRPDDAAMAEIAIRRTAIYRLSGGTLDEVSHTDAPYTP